MSLDIKYDRCDQCGTCISVCPTDALLLTDKLSVDSSKCIVCKKCVNVCPVAALCTT